MYQFDVTTQPTEAGRPGAPVSSGLPAAPPAPADELAARRALRAQIARLERELADTVIEAFGRDAVPHRVPARARGPRLLGLGDLERLRDDLAEKLREARVEVADRGAEYADARALLERMLREPERHKYVRLSLKDLGESGCGVYQVRPRVGLVGMLAGWWHVKLSSGCPLPGGRRPRRPAPLTLRITAMGKRSRKRDVTGRPRARPTAPSAVPSGRTPVPAAPASGATSRRARMAEAPPAPWSPFPLVELCILAGLVLLVVGFFSEGDTRLTLLVVGFALVAVSAIELAIREHFAGFRSHTTLLAAATVVFPLVPLTFAFSVPRVPMMIAGVALFGVMFVVLRSVFTRRADGFGFRA